LKPIIGITVDIESKLLKLNRQYAGATENGGACPVLLTPTRHIADLAVKIDGLIISGGDDLHPSYYKEDINCDMKILDRDRSDFELAIIYEIIKLRKPVLGICYGMQLINVAFGGSLYQDIKAQMAQAIEHKSGFHSVNIGDNKLIGSGEFDVNTSHHQAVKALGTGLRAIAFSEDGIIEAVCMDDYPFLLGVQWHPERLQDSLSREIFNSFVEASGEGK